MQKSQVRLALTFDYGQKAATQEIRCAQELTKKWKIGRESYSFPFGKLCYSWQPIRDDLAKQLLKKIEAKEQVQILFKIDNTVVIAA
jgi:7-cyano-7-deazaguanine synthase in queuosine biosynthesis